MFQYRNYFKGDAISSLKKFKNIKLDIIKRENRAQIKKKLKKLSDLIVENEVEETQKSLVSNCESFYRSKVLEPSNFYALNKKMEYLEKANQYRAKYNNEDLMFKQ